MMERSVLGLIYSYNALPQHMVDHGTVRIFQRALQNAVKTCAKSGYQDWECLLRQGARSNGITSLMVCVSPLLMTL
jgi:hypothetical protein